MIANSPLLTDFLIGTVLGCLHSLGIYIVNDRVGEPYMDEQFHIGQTQLYCRGIFNEWIPMITTPPALYFLAFFFGFCDGYERYVNSMLVPLCYVGICQLRRRFSVNGASREPEITSSAELIEAEQTVEKTLNQWLDVRLPALAILLLPVLLDTSLLFYTDLLSLTAVVWAFSTPCPFHSFLGFTFAVFTRQNNIVWAALYSFPLAWRTFKQFLRNELPLKDALYELFRRCCLHLLLAVCFLGFVIWNGGSVVLGDKAAHQPVFHPPQLLYFFAFTAATALPLFIAHLCCEVWNGRLVNRYSITLFIALSLFALCSVHFCTMAHPYLLADNRHFTFYIWQRLFQRHWMIKYALVPVYALAGTLMLGMAAKMSSMDKLAFIGATALCLVPAELLEFRYFIVPYTLWRCSLGKTRWPTLVAEIGFHMLVNTAALYLFLERPFRWTIEPAKWQRFMW